jgi:hypothetical protein
MTEPSHLSARDVLLRNDRGDHTVPAERLYPFRWLWDSSLIALGWATFDEDRAWRELHASMSQQWQSGMVPHIDFNDGAGDYFPGPATWQTDYNSSGITQPPLTAMTAWHMFTTARDRDLAHSAALALYPKLLAFQRWLYDVRRHHDTGLLLSTHPWETGLDNSPAWDAPMAAVDTRAVPAYVRKDTTHIDNEERPPDAFYDRCYALLINLKANGYDMRTATEHCPFLVADVGFNSIAVRASEDLVRLGIELGLDVTEATELHQRGRAGLASLWNENTSAFTSIDVRNDEPIDIATCSSFFPLITDTPTTTQVTQLANLMNAWAERVTYLLPSFDPNHPSFDERRYWCGPIWINANWFVATGFARHGQSDLARRLQDDSRSLIEQMGCREYFHPSNGTGLGGVNFSWTAALKLSWLDTSFNEER